MTGEDDGQLNLQSAADDLRLDRVLTGVDGLDIINEFVKVFGMAACVLDAESVG
jgi:hypothetical protein